MSVASCLSKAKLGDEVFGYWKQNGNPFIGTVVNENGHYGPVLGTNQSNMGFTLWGGDFTVRYSNFKYFTNCSTSWFFITKIKKKHVPFHSSSPSP
jgi:hypothetical protein